MTLIMIVANDRIKQFRLNETQTHPLTKSISIGFFQQSE